MAKSLFDRVEEWEGRTVVDRNGEKVGKVQDLYFDVATNRPEWALVRTGLFETRDNIVPIIGASRTGDDIRIPFDKDHVKHAPYVDTDEDLSQADEATLARHYGFDYSEARSDNGLPEGRKGRTPDRSGPTSDDAMTRSEEELRIDKARRPSELVRLKKHVVTERQQVTVPVQHEELRVEREPITEANRDRAMQGPDLSDNEHELTLTEEQVVVDKKVVPKERVRLDTDVKTEDVTVNEDVRKEQIDVERKRR